MLTRHQQRFVLGQTAWMLTLVLVLSFRGTFSLELFFIVSFVGFLALLELTAPTYVRLEWRTRLKWIVLVGLLGFVWIIGGRILKILPPRLF